MKYELHFFSVKVLSNFEDPRAYKMANVFMLAYPYGLTRLMSSYYWPRKVINGSHVNAWMGPPSAPDMSTLGVFEGNDTSCQNGWVSLRKQFILTLKQSK